MDYERLAKKLMIGDPFYGLLLLSSNKYYTEDDPRCPTACSWVDGLNFALMFNTKWMDTLTEDEQLAIIKHQLLHIYLGHVTGLYNTLWKENKMLTTIACDLSINQMIRNMPEGSYNYEEFHKKFSSLKPKESSMYYYKELKRLDPSYTFCKERYDNCSNTDEHSSWDQLDGYTEDQIHLMDEHCHTMIKRAAEVVQRTRGTIPAEFQDIVKTLFTVKEEIFDWKAYFRRLLSTSEEFTMKQTHMRESKRFEGAPGFRIKRKHRILVGIDTSGSIGQGDLLDFFSEIYHVYKAGAEVDIVEFDAKIQHIYQYKGENKAEIRGGGGTSFTPFFNYADENKNDYSGVVILTDGYAPIPENVVNNTIWILTADHNSQYYPGKVVEIPKMIK